MTPEPLHELLHAFKVNGPKIKVTVWRNCGKIC